ncbi:MAG: MBL fold metallo-hydrolase [Christensenellaceae bacterium]|nr:MBL fold metallo-hydrolase [Christensenellaceae bacterium]
MALCLTPLFSGSSGNAILVSSQRSKVLIDAGVSGRKLEEALHSIGETVDDIKGILITHEHSDHIQGVGILSRRYNIPVDATAPTWEAACDKLGSVRSMLARVIGKEPFYIDDLLIEPFEIPHDAADPVGYCVTSGHSRLAVATDLGCFPQEVERRLHACDLVLLESNHDLEMLIAGRYPYELKQRIRSRRGHLSNDDAAEAAVRLAYAGVSSILLGHLSRENNSEHLAFRTVTDALLANGITPGRDISLGLAFRDRVTGRFQIR